MSLLIMSARNDDRDRMRDWDLSQDELISINSVASSAGSAATMAVLVQSDKGHSPLCFGNFFGNFFFCFFCVVQLFCFLLLRFPPSVEKHVRGFMGLSCMEPLVLELSKDAFVDAATKCSAKDLVLAFCDGEERVGEV